VTLLELAQRFVGEVHERNPGDDPFIQWCHASCHLSADTPDEVPWCSSFLNRLCWILRLPRSSSAAARSWLTIGRPIDLVDIVVGDVVIFARADDPSSGHVGLYVGTSDEQFVMILGGNQTDQVTVTRFFARSIIGIRRLSP